MQLQSGFFYPLEILLKVLNKINLDTMHAIRGWMKCKSDLLSWISLWRPRIPFLSKSWVEKKLKVFYLQLAFMLSIIYLQNLLKEIHTVLWQSFFAHFCHFLASFDNFFTIWGCLRQLLTYFRQLAKIKADNHNNFKNSQILEEKN